MRYLLIISFIFSTLFAELSPQVYQEWKDRADEVVDIKVKELKIDIKNNIEHIYAKAEVLNVTRSKNGLKKGSKIGIIYSKTHKRPAFIVGPSEVLTLKKDKIYRAYLNKSKDNNYTIAAGGKSFKQE